MKYYRPVEPVEESALEAASEDPAFGGLSNEAIDPNPEEPPLPPKVLIKLPTAPMVGPKPATAKGAINNAGKRGREKRKAAIA